MHDIRKNALYWKKQESTTEYKFAINKTTIDLEPYEFEYLFYFEVYE